jgi:Mrp family chromosome partitioning ATPase/uncharacterized protein involved in exopolysaccharide biosynthesis
MWAFGLAIALGVGGAVAGYRGPPVLYQSAGLIEIQPKVPRILYASEENGLHPMFDSFVESQVVLVSSRRVVDMAMDSPEWRRLGRPRTDEQVALFADSLKAMRQGRSQYVQVVFTDEDPAAAVAGVNAVLEAYRKIVDENETRSGENTVLVLDNKRTGLNNRLAEIRAEVQAVTEDLGPEGLEDRYKSQLDQLGKLDEALNQTDLEIAKLRAESTEGGATMSDEEIALKDDAIQKMAQELAEAEREASYMENVLHIGSADPKLAALQLRIGSLREAIANRLRVRRAAMNATPESRAAAMREGELRRTQIVGMRDAVQDEVRRLGKKRGQLIELEAERKLLNERLEEVRLRLEQITVESSVRGRITIVSAGDRPAGPAKDRRGSLAVLGLLGGAALGFGAVVVWGVRDARMRHVLDVDPAMARDRFLGVLPEVPDEGAEAPAAGEDDPGAMADYCVHHVRTMLQLRSRDHKRVVVLTSPSAGAGKTTLTLALGASFAAAGSKTLLVDCDLVGRGLTSALRSLACEAASRAIIGPDAAETVGARRRSRMEELLSARRVAYQEAQIDELLAAARELARAGDDAGTRAMRALEAVSRRSGDASASHPAAHGILDALGGEDLARCVVELDDRLVALPVGRARGDDAERLSHEALDRLISACRTDYDTILIDTGPILGSLEAALVASVADTALLIVNRGERRKLVDDALANLERIGVDVTGVIFNRASAAEIVRSSYGSRSASRPVEVA